MNPRFQWPTTAESSDILVFDQRRRYEQVFGEAFAARREQWIARVLDEQPLQIFVQFQDATGKVYPPEIHFHAMCEKRDVEDIVSFLPWS
jgi:hypothetical protein